MNRSIDVKAEMHKIASSKPVHAAAGAGALASQTLRELPTRLARWRGDAAVASLSSRASQYMTATRTRAVHGYDKLADRGKRILDGRAGLPGTARARDRRK